MSAVATMEALEAIPTGKSITVVNSPGGNDGRLWTKDGNGRWVCDGSQLEARFFQASVENGCVTLGSGVALALNTFIRRHTDDHWILPLRDEGENVYYCAVWNYNGGFVGHVSTAFEPGRHTVGSPAGASLLLGMLEAQAEVEGEQIAKVRAALHNLHNDLYINGSKINASDLDDLLDELGMGREQRITVEVRVDGYSEIVPSSADFDYFEPQQMEIKAEMTGVRVPWAFNFTHEVTVKPGVCACDEVTQEMVEARAPKPLSAIEFTKSCPNCGA